MKTKRCLLLGVLLASSVMSLFAQFSADKVYTISNRNDANVYMQDNGTGRVQLGGKNDNSYWKLIPTANANCYYVQNAVTEKYMQSTKTANTQVNTGDNPVEICVLDCSAGEGAGMYGMASTDQGTVNFTSGTVGCNWHGDGYVQGFAAASGTNHRSFWKIVEAEMPQPPVPVTPTGWTAPPAPGQNLTSLSSSTYVYAYNIQAEAVLTRGYNWGTKAIADQLENGDAAEGAGRQPITVIPDGNYTIKMHIKDRSADVFVGQANNSDASAAVWSDQGNAGNRVRFTYAESPNYPNAYVLTNLEKNKVLDVMFLRGGPLTLFGGKGYTDWAFVTIDDVKAGKLRQFKARKAMWELYKAVEKAGALDANADALNTALATYTNSDATADDLRAAFRTMFIAVASSIEDPVDASYLFDHPDMAADKSLGNWNWQCDQDAAYGAGEYERWHAVFNAHQTQTVPNGLYDVRFMGIYRLDGGSSTPPLLTATTSETYAANFPNMNDLGGYWNVTNGTDWTNAAVNQRPNQMWTASDALALDQASALIENTKVRNGSLDIRFEVTGGEQWFNWHRVIVTYKGAVNMGLYKTLVAKIAEAEGYVTAKTGVIVQSYLDAINTVIDDVDDLTANSEEEDLTNAIASLNTAISNADAAPTVVNYNFLNETIILCEAEGVPSDDVNAAKNVRDNSTTNTAFTDALNALRIARRIHHAEKDTHSWAGNEPAAGDFYLYNVGQQRFFCGGDDWGAHAALGFPGISVTLESADGAYKINTHLANGKDGDNTKEYLNHNGYCDTWTSDSWQFVEQSGGVYTIARSGDTNLLLGYSTNTYNRLDTDKSDASNPNNQWKLVTKADRDALLATATEDAPQDASYLIKSPGFSQREDVSAWALSGDASIWARGANHPDFAVEAYDKTAAGVEQTVTGLPAGTYKLMVQAFYRDGNFNTQAETLANGGEARQLATLYAGTKSALIQNVSGGADKAPGMGRSSSVGYMPDGIDDACLYFQSGLYWASLDEIVVGQDGTMTIGARKTEKINDGDWMVLDNFRLIYKGAGVDLSGVKADLLAKIGEANTIMTELGLTLSYLNTLAVNGQNVYDNSTEADEIVDATNALQAAINVTQNTTDLTYFKQTVALATGEGVATSAAKAAVEAVNNSENIASVVSAQLYNLRAARKVKALGKPDVYTGSTPAAGKVYLYNIGTGLFLGMGSDWSTHAAVDQVGIEVELVASGEGFQMKSAHGNFNGGAHGPYVDTDGTEVYTFTAVSGNVYNIKQGDLFLGWNPNADTDGLHYWNTIGNTADADGADANFQWKVITASEREALLATAAADNAVDVSYMIKNPSLNRKPDYDMWSKECDGGNGGARVSTQDNNNGNRAADFGYEYYEPNSFAFTQKVEGLKPGNYRVTVQGFYRDGNGDHQKGIVESDGISANAAYLVAKDQQAWLPNISSVKDFVPGQDGLIETTKGSYPNWPRAAIEYFENGAYLTTVDAMVGANGELTIGVKKDTRPNAGDWVVLDNFRLYYLGAPYGINTMSIVGDFTGGWPNGDDWSMAKHMVQDAENPNIWTYIIEDFKAETGTYDYKVTANEQWGVYEKPSEFDPKNERGNAEFTFGTEGYPAGHYRLVFTVNTSTHTLTLDVQKPTVTISENADYVASATEDALILLNREFKNEETWNTFVVPFAINTTDLKRAFGENVEVAVYSENSDNPNNVTISFTTMDEPAVSANVPVLLKTDVTATEFLFKSDIVEDTPKVVGNNFDFVGSYAANKVIDEGDYYLSQNTLFKSAGIGSYVKGTRAYLHAKDVVEGRIVNLFIDGEEQTTGISTMQNSPSTMHNEVYNLNGQKMEKQSLRKGLYIVNGKKVVK